MADVRSLLPTLFACAASAPHPEVVRALPCVDVAVHPLRVADPGAIVRIVYELSNHCEREVPIDFAATGVDAVLDDGTHVRLAAHAIDGSVPRAVLDNSDHAAEVILYGVASHDLTGMFDASAGLAPVASACIDVARVAPESNATPICVRRADDEWVVVAASDPVTARSAAIVDAHATVRTVDPDEDDRAMWRHTDNGLTYSIMEFAPWRRHAPLAARLGMSLHQLHAGRAMTATARMTSSAPQDSQVDSFDGDVGGYVGHLYLGAELQYAPAISRLLGAGGVVGAVMPRIAGLGSQLEVYASVANGWVIEPRVRALAWITPHLALEPWAGYGMQASRGEWSLGLAASLHLRSYH